MALTSSSQALLEESDYRVRHLRDQAASGLSVAEYCRRHDICLATFYNWRRWSRTQRPETGRVSFTEIGRVAESQPCWAVEVVLISGAVVRVSGAADVHLVRALLGALV